MKCSIHFYLLNEHFSEEHAEANHNGEESDMNRKYEWEDELLINNVLDIVEQEKANYPLQGSLADGKAFSYDVADMRLFDVLTEDTPVTVGCSESIMESCELSKNGDDFDLKIYIKDFEPMSNPVPGIFIATQEFPKELIGE
ncbi:MAG: hypothetical protein COA33_003455 [Fluviicola sp.]|nr:hypothetical protein [Fluviicola sp.]